MIQKIGSDVEISGICVCVGDNMEKRNLDNNYVFLGVNNPMNII